MSRARRKNASNADGGSRQPPPLIARKFVSEDAETLYREQLCTRAFVPERGFMVPSHLYRGVIEEFGWQRLCAHPRPGVAPLVKEFHANLPDHSNSSCYARGRWVDFGPAAINRYYALPHGHSDAFGEFFAAPDLDAVIRRLTTGGASWRRNPRGQCKDFPRGALTEEARIWFYFVSSCILPSRHLSTVYTDRAVLVYAIMERLRFDAGHFIHRSFLEAARSRSTGGISHPHLITALCSRAGVQTFDQEERVRSISALPVTRIRAHAPEVPAAEDVDHGEDRVVDSDEEVREEESREEEARAEEGPSEQPAGPSAPAPDTLTLEYLHSMSERQEAFFAEQREVSDRVAQRLDSLFRNQRSAMNNQRDLWDQQNAMIARMGELAERQEHLYSLANAAFSTLTLTPARGSTSQPSASRTTLVPLPPYRPPERQGSPRPYRSPQ